MVRYLHHKEVILLNALIIKRYSPGEQIGVKEPALLDSAVNRPQQRAFGEEAYPTLWLKAAALYSSIAQHYAFHNANKRTAFAAMKQLIWVNGYQLMVPENEAADFTVELVVRNPSLNVEEIGAWIKDHSKQRDMDK
ncbi:type II toxin-antitoxin system death-on-curing family toxin [Aureibacillus halotolerans]|uniref:Death-on-curing protein n=1 Tax=Aureibacillus halotolerans TaxID=1508390 RepID=A0A4R6TUX5_9BACI|nr:type II toxin-antitoxin system death-on-curing family toxin [Aureibacillus halotolerans]TDQ34624.1 death-on-curing protein [Aureibacillus halotolerans]